MRNLLLYLIFAAIPAFYTPGMAQLSSNNLSVYSDLEGANINDVITDRMGIVWMATLNGLVRYDGYEYKRYYPDPNDSTTLGSILTYRLFEDRKGNIWISCMDLISVYNPETRSFKNYTISGISDFPTYSQAVIPTITADANGRIYFGTASMLGFISSHALLYKDEDEDEIRRFENPDSLEIQNIYNATSDKQGNVWIVAINGFFRIDPNRQIHKEKWPQGSFPVADRFNYLIKCDDKGNVWLSSPEALLSLWNPSTGAIKTWPGKNIFTDNQQRIFPNKIKIDLKGNIWIGTSQGLIYFNRQKEKFETLDNGMNNKPDRTPINCLYIDSFENVWMGTDSRGLLRYTNKPVLKSYVFNSNDKNSITAGWVNKIFENSGGKIWISTSGIYDRQGLSELDPAKQTLTPFPYTSILPGMDFYDIYGELSPGVILIRTNKGHFLFNTMTKTVKSTRLAPVLARRHLFNVKKDLSGNLWYCTDSGAYFQSRGKETLRHFNLSEMTGAGISSTEVTDIFDSRKHGIWLLTNGGLFLYNKTTGKIERHGFDKQKGDVLLSQDINSFYEDHDGIAWVGTWGGGLSRYNVETRKIRTYKISDGLPSMSIQGILPDEKNKALWLSTFEGISRFSIADEQFNNYSQEDGIQGRLFADGAYLKTSGGFFVFGGNNGITVFNPADIANNSVPPKVFIMDFRIGNTSMGKSTKISGLNGMKKMNEIVLDFTQNNISIEFTGIHYGNPVRNKFAYKLMNYDDDWRLVGNVRTAYYYNLPPGNYVFQVKAANSYGVWNEAGATLNFSITPPWWKTWWAYVIYGLLAIAVVFLVDRFQRRRILNRERTLAKEKELEQGREIEKAYHTLKTTQTQLLHSEKMASLGELTAGIAHEIQNPLNFVNNFSELNTELIDELLQEMDKGNMSEAKLISNDIRENEQKINHHGKRADAIVKGMLQHSRSSTGVKEPTDINALADEYLRLAYHGLRAKDKSFNATMKSNFDESIGKINVVPQDIGRVILNLITNAFYACAERRLLSDPDSYRDETSRSTVNEKKKSNIVGYDPVVMVTTKKSGNIVEIIVSDNGNGIPEHVIDKIFQPFFTTKPAGEGTGLGLSMSYEIVTKGHNGELKVETGKGVGTSFTIVLPDKNMQ
jgi:signal transduction histidine kinase/ligand-binding sensor domain-containing protein